MGFNAMQPGKVKKADLICFMEGGRIIESGSHDELVARRVRMQAPSLYAYFPSKMALYDALFLMGVRMRAAYRERLFVRDPAISFPNIQTAENDRRMKENQGSNGWVIGPSKSATGHAMLFINPHLPFFGSGQVYEGHVHSDEGWNFTGYTRFGFPLPYVGHNENGGWVSTDNAADHTDVYAETFDDPKRPLGHRDRRVHRGLREDARGSPPQERRYLRDLLGH